MSDDEARAERAKGRSRGRRRHHHHRVDPDGSNENAAAAPPGAAAAAKSQSNKTFLERLDDEIKHNAALLTDAKAHEAATESIISRTSSEKVMEALFAAAEDQVVNAYKEAHRKTETFFASLYKDLMQKIESTQKKLLGGVAEVVGKSRPTTKPKKDRPELTAASALRDSQSYVQRLDQRQAELAQLRKERIHTVIHDKEKDNTEETSEIPPLPSRSSGAQCPACPGLYATMGRSQQSRIINGLTLKTVPQCKIDAFVEPSELRAFVPSTALLMVSFLLSKRASASSGPTAHGFCLPSFLWSSIAFCPPQPLLLAHEHPYDVFASPTANAKKLSRDKLKLGCLRVPENTSTYGSNSAAVSDKWIVICSDSWVRVYERHTPARLAAKAATESSASAQEKKPGATDDPAQDDDADDGDEGCRHGRKPQKAKTGKRGCPLPLCAPSLQFKIVTDCDSRPPLFGDLLCLPTTGDYNVFAVYDIAQGVHNAQSHLDDLQHAKDTKKAKVAMKPLATVHGVDADLSQCAFVDEESIAVYDAPKIKRRCFARAGGRKPSADVEVDLPAKSQDGYSVNFTHLDRGRIVVQFHTELLILDFRSTTKQQRQPIQTRISLPKGLGSSYESFLSASCLSQGWFALSVGSAIFWLTAHGQVARGAAERELYGSDVATVHLPTLVDADGNPIVKRRERVKRKKGGKKAEDGDETAETPPETKKETTVEAPARIVKHQSLRELFESKFPVSNAHPMDPLPGQRNRAMQISGPSFRIHSSTKEGGEEGAKQHRYRDKNKAATAVTAATATSTDEAQDPEGMPPASCFYRLKLLGQWSDEGLPVTL